MRILLDPGAHDQRNKGNVALLQVASRRLHLLWPNASIEVFSDAPHLLRLFCPDVYPVSPFGKDKWYENHAQYDQIHQFIPKIVFRLLFEIRDEIRYHRMGRVLEKLNEKPPFVLTSENAEPESEFDNMDVRKDGNIVDVGTPISEIFRDMDLFVASGGGYMCDSDKVTALAVLQRLDDAIKQNIPTVMVGQGMGPIRDFEFCQKASAILPKVGLILVRERSIAPALLESFGVDPQRIIVTGDDAVELAYEARSDELGNGIGVNLRIARYTEVGLDHINSIKPILHASASKFNAILISLPIAHSQNIETVDAWAIQQLLDGYHHVRSGRLGYAPPSDIIKRVSKCRLVVTGAFHPAVFALAQGIPVVCIAKSDEYVGKFSTLADMFGIGCEVLRLDDTSFRGKFEKSIENAWYTANTIRSELLTASNRQIKMGQKAYRRIGELVTSNKLIN
jgi:polysaccharide pyruvyl transferase WcaK-like protein